MLKSGLVSVSDVERKDNSYQMSAHGTLQTQNGHKTAGTVRFRTGYCILQFLTILVQVFKFNHSLVNNLYRCLFISLELNIVPISVRRIYIQIWS